VSLLNENSLHVSYLGNKVTSDGYVVFDISFDIVWGPDVPSYQEYEVANSRINATQYFIDGPGVKREYHFNMDGESPLSGQINGNSYMQFYNMVCGGSYSISLYF
jgi:hypothetical protein